MKTMKRTTAAAREGNRTRATDRAIQSEAKRPREDKCRVCGCTEMEACDPPCSWAEPGLCSTCGKAALAVAEWQVDALHPNKAALLREAAELGKAGLL